MDWHARQLTWSWKEIHCWNGSNKQQMKHFDAMAFAHILSTCPQHSMVNTHVRLSRCPGIMSSWAVAIDRHCPLPSKWHRQRRSAAIWMVENGPAQPSRLGEPNIGSQTLGFLLTNMACISFYFPSCSCVRVMRCIVNNLQLPNVCWKVH